uniref:phospholipase A2 n=1 Tax=Monopterus albus TaxID=43700 RepID=A0A3Q3KDV7_MONAL
KYFSFSVILLLVLLCQGHRQTHDGGFKTYFSIKIAQQNQSGCLAHYTFLRQGSSSLRLYHSAWSAGRTLLRCTWSDDAAVTHSYLSLCRERPRQFTDHPNVNVDFKSMLEAEDVCVSLASPGMALQVERAGKRPVRSVGGLPAAEQSQGQGEGPEVRTHRRLKRSFTVPGTLWCGSGNKAPSFEDLGVFTDTDSCCREHDQCQHSIPSFHSDFGVFNSNIYTMSHCDCDNRFRRCLQDVNDSISSAVGYTFFNLLKIHCFEFAHQTKMSLYAEVHSSPLYEPASPAELSMNSTSSTDNTTAPAELPESSVSVSQHLSSISAFHTTATELDLSMDAFSTEKQLFCDVYKVLDECRNKILPQQRRYGLHNPEPRTLYHCNCTHHKTSIASSVFNSCTAVLVEAEHPQLNHGSGEEVEEQRHLQAVSLKVRRPDSMTARGKGRAVRLDKLCVRLMNGAGRHNQTPPGPAA